ncbi:hypothetical protein M9H77_18891 [Catharanthus roseus]|uniref:Uncharacterized protein n=1 Tax=Catharanthus roseus TaxID=4058 RepID=A0ACC0B8Z6_CATRO|nr:hypothetical protein M9H77_18891 [Catharanthus roseus]
MAEKLPSSTQLSANPSNVEAGKPLVIEEVIVAPPKAHEVRIKIICASLCFSDVTFWRMKVPLACFLRIFGHEAVGEYTMVDVASVTKIDPNTIPPNRACLLSCGVSTDNSFTSVKAGSSVVIFGLGSIGLASSRPMAENGAVLSPTAGKPIKCRAAVAREAGKPLVIEEVIVAPPKAHEVPPGCFPRILGHEAVGVVESVGEDVHELTTGDTVIPIFLPDCAECMDCKSRKSNLCSKFPFHVASTMPRDGTSRFTDLKGETINHFLWISSFSEYTVVDVASVTKIDPNTIPPNRACLLSCGVSTGNLCVKVYFEYSGACSTNILLADGYSLVYAFGLCLGVHRICILQIIQPKSYDLMQFEFSGVGAAWRTASVEPGSSVVIFGLGSIGLAVAEGARLCGATRIIGVDVNSDKFEIAKKFGVTEFVNSKSCGDRSVSQVIIDMTEGGADYCFECVGMASLVQEAYACCRKGWGKTIVLGVDKPGAQLNFNSFEVLHSGKTLLGSLYGGLKPKSDVPILIKRYMDKELELDKFVTHEVSFEDINKAFELLIAGESLRCVIWMDESK